MKITIDSKLVEISPEDKNIVDAADRAGIGIPAPCYRDNRSGGCCKSCVVEIDGEQRYACGIKPRDGMNIIVKREDLKLIRKERLKVFREQPTSATCDCKCSCNSPDSDGSCC